MSVQQRAMPLYAMLLSVNKPAAEIESRQCIECRNHLLLLPPENGLHKSANAIRKVVFFCC